MKMELYFKNEKGQLELTTLKDLLNYSFSKAGYEMDIGNFEGGNHHWVGVVQKSKKPSKVVTNILFKEDCNKITGLHVYETPIITVEDDDNSKQIV